MFGTDVPIFIDIHQNNGIETCVGMVPPRALEKGQVALLFKFKLNLCMVGHHVRKYLTFDWSI